MSRERTIYRETYRKGVRLKPEALPELKHLTDDGAPFKAVACELLAAGAVQRADGTIAEYQDLRVFVEVA